MLGHEVTIFEERSEAGGMLRFAIPEYRLPKSVLRRELELIEAIGVKFVVQHTRWVWICRSTILRRFDAVFLSVGTWKESWLYLPGHRIERCASGATIPGVGRET